MRRRRQWWLRASPVFASARIAVRRQCAVRTRSSCTCFRSFASVVDRPIDYTRRPRTYGLFFVFSSTVGGSTCLPPSPDILLLAPSFVRPLSTPPTPAHRRRPILPALSWNFDRPRNLPALNDAMRLTGRDDRDTWNPTKPPHLKRLQRGIARVLGCRNSSAMAVRKFNVAAAVVVLCVLAAVTTSVWATVAAPVTGRKHSPLLEDNTVPDKKPYRVTGTVVLYHFRAPRPVLLLRDFRTAVKNAGEPVKIPSCIPRVDVFLAFTRYVVRAISTRSKPSKSTIF